MESFPDQPFACLMLIRDGVVVRERFIVHAEDGWGEPFADLAPDDELSVEVLSGPIGADGSRKLLDSLTFWRRLNHWRYR